MAVGRGVAAGRADPSTTPVGPFRCTRTAEPSAGIVTSRSARPPAVTWTAASRTSVGAWTSVPSTATSRYGAPATHTAIGPLSVLTTRTLARLPGAAATVASPAFPLTVWVPP